MCHFDLFHFIYRAYDWGWFDKDCWERYESFFLNHRAISRCVIIEYNFIKELYRNRQGKFCHKKRGFPSLGKSRKKAWNYPWCCHTMVLKRYMLHNSPFCIAMVTYARGRLRFSKMSSPQNLHVYLISLYWIACQLLVNYLYKNYFRAKLFERKYYRQNLDHVIKPHE